MVPRESQYLPADGKKTARARKGKDMDKNDSETQNEVGGWGGWMARREESEREQMGGASMRHHLGHRYQSRIGRGCRSEAAGIIRRAPRTRLSGMQFTRWAYLTESRGFQD